MAESEYLHHDCFFPSVFFKVPPGRKLGACDNAISRFSSGVRNPVRSLSKYNMYIFIKSQRFGHCSHGQYAPFGPIGQTALKGEGHVCIADKGAFSVTNHSLAARTKSEPICLTGNLRIAIL